LAQPILNPTEAIKLFLSQHAHLQINTHNYNQGSKITSCNDACGFNMRIKLKHFKESGNRGYLSAIGLSEKRSSGLDSGAFTTKVKDQSASKAEDF